MLKQTVQSRAKFKKGKGVQNEIVESVVPFARSVK